MKKPMIYGRDSPSACCSTAKNSGAWEGDVTKTELTTAAALADLLASPLRPLSKADEKSARSALRDFAARAPELGEALAKNGALADFLAATFSLSPFLRDTAFADPAMLARAVTEPLDHNLDALCRRARQAWKPSEGADGSVTEQALMASLRRLKREAALTLGLADLAGVASAAETTAWLSDARFGHNRFPAAWSG
jgi:[glutamine synthetase] adenylyltransferase / [glutamine synthetase]-adenylyl-L-tyrosine phosphorylase